MILRRVRMLRESRKHKIESIKMRIFKKQQTSAYTSLRVRVSICSSFSGFVSNKFLLLRKFYLLDPTHILSSIRISLSGKLLRVVFFAFNSVNLSKHPFLIIYQKKKKISCHWVIFVVSFSLSFFRWLHTPSMVFAESFIRIIHQFQSRFSCVEILQQIWEPF